MSEPSDIQSVLQNGYFTTSRTKSAQSPSPRHLTPPASPSVPSYRRNACRSSGAVENSRRQFRPPPPTVEDEVDALAKEYSAVSGGELEEEAQSRGDVEQQPIILEVHEHNPERRFVIVPNSTETPASSHKNGDVVSEKRRKQQSGDGRPSASNAPRNHEPVFEDSLDAGGGHPAVSRRRSRQDLPPIDTTMRQGRVPEHHRTRSAVGPRPDGFSARPSTRSRDDMLSPDTIKHGSNRREKAYHDYGTSTSGPRRLPHQRSYSNLTDHRKREKSQRWESVSPAYGARSESTPDPRKPRRRLSNERTAELRPREDTSALRNGKRESTPYKRGDGEATPATSTPKPMGPRPCRAESRSSDEQGSNSRSAARRRENPSSIHQESDRIPSPEKARGPWQDDRMRSSGPSIPTYPPPTSVPVNEMPKNLRASTTFPITGEVYQANHLPYPDDVATGRAPRSPTHPSQAVPSASMPEFPLPTPVVPADKSSEAPNTSSPATANTPSWPPPSFDPERDGLSAETEAGSYRRYSEGRGGSDIPRFPECQRKEPVAGMMDWLTLPRTDFNICPDCYQGVFSNTEYRTQFQPILRPTGRAIACDFGSSPWFRIAWLLALKNEHSDLRLIHQVANVATASRNQPCPGSRKALRNWFIIRDPCKRRSVPNFTVCYQCAKTAEVLLPNLMGTFIPLDSRQEPVSSVCALHFKPQRKRFALYFDTLETTADKAIKANEPPDVSALASKIERLSIVDECREDTPIPDTYWHTMQFLPDFTVCAECFDEAVRPKLGSNIIARNFYKDPQRMPLATCQLYSARMREIFNKACRKNDPKYLKAKVIERRQVEADIHGQLVKLDKAGQDSAWTEEQVKRLIKEWKKWE